MYLTNQDKFGNDDDSSSIPLADDDSAAIVADSSTGVVIKSKRGVCESLDSIPSMMSDQLIPSSSAGEGSNPVGEAASYISEQMAQLCADSDYSLDDAEEKAKLISQVCNALIASGRGLNLIFNRFLK